MKAVVTLFKGKETRTVHAVDVEAWLKVGWKLETDPTERGVNEELVKKDVLPLTEAIQTPKSERKTPKLEKLEKDITANDR